MSLFARRQLVGVQIVAAEVVFQDFDDKTRVFPQRHGFEFQLTHSAIPIAFDVMTEQVVQFGVVFQLGYNRQGRLLVHGFEQIRLLPNRHRHAHE